MVPMYAPTWTPWNSRANAAARLSTNVSCCDSPQPAASASASSSGSSGRIPSRPPRGSRATDAPDACICRDRVATSMQTAHSRPCGFPLDHVAVRGARPHEAVGVAFVSAVLAAAEARDVAGDLGMLGGELKRRRDDFDGPRRCVSLERNRRKVGLFVRTERRLRLGRRDDFRRRLSALGKLRSIGRRRGRRRPLRRRGRRCRCRRARTRTRRCR